MSSCSPPPPDWTAVKFDDGRFQVIHNLLDEYENRIRSGNDAADKSQFLAQCITSGERDIMSQEMDYLDELRKNPIKFVGGYLVEKTVAVGGFGIVSLGFSPDGTPVAIKVPHMSWHIAKTRDDLDVEAMILREMDHVNIVRFVDCGYDENWYMITEWIDGYNLREALENIRAPLVQWLDIVSQVCDALSFGHQQGVIHRDITPRNIMVTGDERPIAKVLDYGVAKRVNPDQDLSGKVNGTRKYIAPEQYFGHSDERSDIFSLGVVLKEIVSFQYRNTSRIPRPIARVISKATQRNPDRRFQSAEQFKDAIRKASDGITNGDIPLVRKPPRFLNVGYLLAALLVTTTIIWLVSPWGSIPSGTTSPAANLASNGQPGTPEKFDLKQPWQDFFDARGRPRIVLDSRPTGAFLTLYNLKGGDPDPKNGIELGFAPANANVPAGDYLVVAEWPDGNWNEVFRRLPNSQTRGIVPLSSFDAFGKDPHGLKFAPVTKPRFSSEGMVKLETIWIDASVAIRQPSCRCGYSPFGDACERLEQQGKRLPFASELRRGLKSKKVHSPASEWTGSLNSEDGYPTTLANGRKIYLQLNKYLVIPDGDISKAYPLLDHAMEENVDFRGVRSLTPFGR